MIAVQGSIVDRGILPILHSFHGRDHGGGGDGV